MTNLQVDELHSAITLRTKGQVRSAGPALAGGPAAPKEAKVVKEKPQWGVPGQGKAAKEKAKKEKTETAPDVPVVETPLGEKKDMSLPIAAAYDPSAVEAAWGAWWEKESFFTPDAKKAVNSVPSKKFVMVIPPPNVTGTLHLGHALTCSIEDALTRWHRMCGNATLWLPGTDHAGIATQSVVERQLYKQENLTRHDLGREKFLERVWAWKEKNGNHICKQLRRVAASVDWTRERFTMDARLGRAVEEAFIRFHGQGLIRRDNRLVNWCPHLRTALSDLEVDHQDIPGKTLLTIPGYAGQVEVGVLAEFKYMLKGSKDFLIVATTRVETMLGDVAVAVHPEDERYAKFVGKELVHPFFPDRKMVVVADPMVEREFGTGCVKITPAHDHNDHRVGKAHKLANINVFGEDGHVNSNGGEFEKQHRFEARKTVEKALTDKGLWVGKKSHPMRLGLCSRSKDIIEPYLKPQWWMNCNELAAKSVKAVREGELKIVPEFHHQTWYHWLENIQEWCISRQLWWGHRIPAYKVVKPAQKEELWFVGRSKEEAAEKAKKHLGVKSVEVVQDEDVLDTWFSSGLFPFSVFGWPDNTEDFNAFFPTSLLETGHDILFFWVARMVMMSIGLTGKLPFHTVYLHAMVRDAHGRKMSKSLGNVIDPIEVIDGITLPELITKLHQGNLPEKEVEKAVAGQKADFPNGIPQCGADALRFGLLAYTSQGRNVNLDIQRVVGYRHFCNKVWNATRFALMYFGAEFRFSGGVDLAGALAWEDKWILSRLSVCAEKSNQAFEKYDFAGATTACYSFFYYEFCDVYLELLKPRFHGLEVDISDEVKADQQAAREVLYTCLDRSLRLMHPLLPYLTEELYQRLPYSPAKAQSITIANYPTAIFAWNNDGIEKQMEVAFEIAKRFRSQKTSLGLAPNSRPRGFVRHNDAEWVKKLTKIGTRIGRMAGVGDVEALGKDAKDPKGTLRDVVNDKCIIFTEVAGLDLSQELAKLQKKVVTSDKMVASFEAKMNVPSYEEKVPSDIRDRDAEKLEASRTESEELRRAVKNIEAAMK